MNKKGFTLAELLGVIVVIAILSVVAVVSVNSIIENGKKGVYQNLENTLKGATQNYLVDNPSSIPAVGANRNITYNVLISGNYIDKLEDPKGGECSSSYVKVTRDANKGNNLAIDYKSCIICKDNAGNIHYKTSYDDFNC